MNIYNDIFESLTTAWKSDENLKKYKIYEQFPGTNQEMPLRNVHIIVGLDSAYLTGQDGLSITTAAIYGKVVIKANICSPKTKSGTQCIRIFEQLSKATRDVSSNMEIISIEANKMEYNNSIGGLVLPVKITLSSKLYA